MAMKAYESYKNVDLPWLKRVPEHWEIARNKNFLSERKAIVGDNFTNYSLLSLTLNGIIIRDVNNGKGKFPASFNTYKIVSPGDIVFCLFDMDETPRTVGLSTHHGMITNAYEVLGVHNINPQYLYYYYLQLDNRKALKPLYHGLRKTISIGTFLQTKLPVPPKEEQDQIVRYLDWQNSRLNKLINAKKREIALLEEQKQALISQAVTKGLDPHAPLKDSGIDWIGQIPEHWEIKMLCQIAKPKKNLKPTNKMYPVLSLSYGRIIQKKDINAGLVPTTYDNYQLVIEGDIILRFTDLQNDHTSLRTGLVQQEGIITSAYTCIRPNKISEYLHMLLHSCDIHKVFYGMGSGIRQSIGYKDVRYMKLPFPPLKEQIDIVKFIDKQINKINSYIKGTQTQVSLLQEYRTRLVADVVTGQIDVRHIAIPNYEAITETIDQPEADEDSTICTEDQ